MNRQTAKLIVMNCVQLFEIITRGGKNTFVNINGLVVNSKNINNFMDNIQLIRSYVDGAQIEYRLSETSDPWCGIDEPSFIAPFEYRVKPALREFYVVKSKRTGEISYVYEVYASFPVDKINYEYIKVRELP